MNLIQAIEHTRWQMLSMFAEFGFSPVRVMSEFKQDEIYYLYRARRNKPSVMVERLHERPAPKRAASTAGQQAQTREFPNDVTPLTEREATDMVRMSMLLKAAKKTRSAQLTRRERIFLWDDERRAVCLGSDPVARRCAMDDYLWAAYRHCKLRGMTLRVDACRHIYQTKLLVAPLFDRSISRSSGDGERPCYLSVPDAPDETSEDGRKARQAFDAIFDNLRERIKTTQAARRGRDYGAN